MRTTPKTLKTLGMLGLTLGLAMTALSLAPAASASCAPEQTLVPGVLAEDVASCSGACWVEVVHQTETTPCVPLP